MGIDRKLAHSNKENSINHTEMDLVQKTLQLHISQRDNRANVMTVQKPLWNV